jgi:hypothetical protein
MDFGESMNLPFWFDDLDNFYYMPEHAIASMTDLYEKYGITSNEIMQCKAWWNTNLPMDHFVPTIIPGGASNIDPEVCLINFIERVKQRSLGLMCPAPPELNLKPGIIIMEKNTFNIKGMIINLPGTEKDELKHYDIEDKKVSGSWITGEVIKRNPDFLYWNMIEGKYV